MAAIPKIRDELSPIEGMVPDLETSESKVVSGESTWQKQQRENKRSATITVFSADL